MTGEQIIYKTIDIANSFIQKGLAEEKYFDILQIHKLVYFFYGYAIVIDTGFEIDEKPVTKVTGPMFKGLLEITGDTNKKPISELLENGECAKFHHQPPHDHQLLFDYVYNKYSHMSGKEMSDITHEEGSPWTIASKNGKYLGKKIPQDLIKNHFRKLFIKELQEYNQENGG